MSDVEIIFEDEDGRLDCLEAEAEIAFLRGRLAERDQQLAARNQQIAVLREARDTLCECIHDVEPDDFRACGTCWHKLDSAILALLAPPAAGQQQPEDAS